MRHEDRHAHLAPTPIHADAHDCGIAARIGAKKVRIDAPLGNVLLDDPTEEALERRIRRQHVLHRQVLARVSLPFEQHHVDGARSVVIHGRLCCTQHGLDGLFCL